ncbi:MAG TPA: metallophosphoesterase [Polyangia bacterium]|nr:metallophosphoesterase [Polyangia bacterium]
MAAYVYVADQAVSRGQEDGSDFGKRWRRTFDFRIGVRDVPFWSDSTTCDLLTEILEFLADDNASFRFEEARGIRPTQAFLPMDQHVPDWFKADRVISFSGGLDSLAGAVQEIEAGRNVALVSHRASTKLDPVQRKLVDELRAQAASRGQTGIFHFPVWVRKTAESDREATQRSRSFLFASLGGVVAYLLGLEELTFFENGVVSLNLPVCSQVVGARATRTTHPKVLTLFGRLLSKVFDKPFDVVNPFLWKTKGEVVSAIVDNGYPQLIAKSVSCSHTIEMTETAPHCGTCSQCIDRRFGILAVGAEDLDPATSYRTDLFTAARETTEERTMLETYVLRAREIGEMDDRTFFARFGEAARALSHIPGTATENGRAVAELYRRHAAEIAAVLKQELDRRQDDIVKGKIPPGSLLSMIVSVPRQSTNLKASANQVTSESHRRRFRVLHISDTHFSEEAWDQNHILSALAEDVSSFRERSGAADLVIFTGDIAQTGKAAEYRMADEWLRQRLLPAAAVEPERVVLVPGNHDVDRSKISAAGKMVHDAMLQKQDHDVVAAILADPLQRQLLLAGHAEWLDFARRFGGPVSDVPWCSRLFDIRGVQVRVAQLCSSWCAYGPADHARLLLGKYQVLSALGYPAGDGEDVISLAALHHPWEMLAEFDCTFAREEIRRRCDVVLRGHLHTVDGVQAVSPASSCIELAAGASYSGSGYRNSYQWVDVDPTARRVRVHMRLWDDHGWISDRNRYGGKGKDGYVDFAMPRRGKGARSTRGRATA